MNYWKEAERLTDTAHLLIAGTTGSGKSVMLNNLITSTMASPRCGYAYAFIDLKRIELSEYKASRLCKGYATTEQEAADILDGAIELMERRYKAMRGRRSDDPHLFVVIDELADLVTNKGIIERLVKIGRLGRAANIHLICATQDPSRRTLKAELMQNFTCAVALRCRSAIESRQIIGVKGAELLPRHGEAIVWDADGIRHIEVPMRDEATAKAVIRHYKKWFFGR